MLSPGELEGDSLLSHNSLRTSPPPRPLNHTNSLQFLTGKRIRSELYREEYSVHSHMNSVVAALSALRDHPDSWFLFNSCKPPPWSMLSERRGQKRSFWRATPKSKLCPHLLYFSLALNLNDLLWH